MAANLILGDSFAVRATFGTPLVLTNAFVNGAVYTITKALTGITLACKYTRSAGVAGAPEMRIEWSRDQSNWFFDPSQGTLTASAPFGSIPSYIGTYPLPVPASDAAILVLVPNINVPAGAQYMRCSFKDGGAGLGTLAVELWPGLVQS